MLYRRQFLDFSSWFTGSLMQGAPRILSKQKRRCSFKKKVPHEKLSFTLFGVFTCISRVFTQHWKVSSSSKVEGCNTSSLTVSVNDFLNGDKQTQDFAANFSMLYHHLLSLSALRFLWSQDSESLIGKVVNQIPSTKKIIKIKINDFRNCLNNEAT